VLDDDPDGFLLMVEGGAVDWASHFNQTGRMIEELIAFTEAVDAVIEWVEGHGGWARTLLVVTADHETGMLWGPGAGTVRDIGGFSPITDEGMGVVPGVSWSTIGHTSQLVPLYAIGDAARLFMGHVVHRDPVRGAYIDNTDIAQVIFAAMR
jgi:alkaline phosphatase